MSQRFFSSGLKAGAMLLVATLGAPAMALTTFAQFNQANSDEVAVYSVMGDSAAFSLVPADVLFDILAFGPLGTYAATLTGSATTDSPFVVDGPLGSRGGWTGSFSFDSGGTNYLTVSFTNAVLVGVMGGTSAAFLASTPGSTISYSSDVIDVSGFSLLDFALGISGLSPSYGSGAATYGGELTGGFAGGVVPEPGVWAMLIVGFGLVGAASRRRRLSRTAHISA